ncbi:hypothetical protein Isolate57596_27010 [Mycobacteroides abscessus subsp. abscessus]
MIVMIDAKGAVAPVPEVVQAFPVGAVQRLRVHRYLQRIAAIPSDHAPGDPLLELRETRAAQHIHMPWLQIPSGWGPRGRRQNPRERGRTHRAINKLPDRTPGSHRVIYVHTTDGMAARHRARVACGS